MRSVPADSSASREPWKDPCGFCGTQTERSRPLHTPAGAKFCCTEEHRHALFMSQPVEWRQAMLASPEVQAAVKLLRGDA